MREGHICHGCQFIDYARPAKDGGRICKRRSLKLRESGKGGSVRVKPGAPACVDFMIRRMVLA